MHSRARGVDQGALRRRLAVLERLAKLERGRVAEARALGARHPARLDGGETVVAAQFLAARRPAALARAAPRVPAVLRRPGRRRAVVAAAADAVVRGAVVRAGVVARVARAAAGEKAAGVPGGKRLGRRGGPHAHLVHSAAGHAGDVRGQLARRAQAGALRVARVERLGPRHRLEAAAAELAAGADELGLREGDLVGRPAVGVALGRLPRGALGGGLGGGGGTPRGGGGGDEARAEGVEVGVGDGPGVEFAVAVTRDLEGAAAASLVALGFAPLLAGAFELGVRPEPAARGAAAPDGAVVRGGDAVRLGRGGQ